jgi:hypothetical protein
MFDLKAHLFARSAIGFELVGDHDARRSCRLLEKLAHEPLRGSSISPALDENVENEAILIDSAPKPVLPASDRDHNLIHVPLVAASRCPPANAIGILPAEFLRPMTNTFVANVNAAGGEHFLDHPQAERKSKIEPNCMRNLIGWEAMSAVEGITRMFHDPPLSANRPRLVKLAVPLAEIIGDHWMSTLWGCAFEDLVSAGRAERNVADDYLKRRGWKESAGTRAYIAALRRSSMSLYEVSDIVGGVPRFRSEAQRA